MHMEPVLLAALDVHLGDMQSMLLLAALNVYLGDMQLMLLMAAWNVYLGNEAMAPDPLRERQAARHEHAWPVDCMEAQDVLADDVVGRPAVLLQVVRCRLHSFWQQTCSMISWCSETHREADRKAD